MHALWRQLTLCLGRVEGSLDRAQWGGEGSDCARAVLLYAAASAHSEVCIGRPCEGTTGLVRARVKGGFPPVSLPPRRPSSHGRPARLRPPPHFLASLFFFLLFFGSAGILCDPWEYGVGKTTTIFPHCRGRNSRQVGKFWAGSPGSALARVVHAGKTDVGPHPCEGPPFHIDAGQERPLSHEFPK